MLIKMKTMLVFFLLTTEIAISAKPPRAPPPPPGLGDFDYYLLAIQWPKSYCRLPKSNCENPNSLGNEFSIHGLWPQKIGGDPVTSMEEFEYGQIIMFSGTLKANWFDANDKTDTYRAVNFWKYEWNTHGRQSALTQKVYFSRALKLFAEVNQAYGLFKVKYPVGILFDVNKFAREFQNLGIPRMVCNNKNNKNELSEMHFRVFHNGSFDSNLEPTSCISSVLLPN